MMSLKKKICFKLKFKTFKTLKTIIFNRKIYKKQNRIFLHLYFTYKFFFKLF